MWHWDVTEIYRETVSNSTEWKWQAQAALSSDDKWVEGGGPLPWWIQDRGSLGISEYLNLSQCPGCEKSDTTMVMGILECLIITQTFWHFDTNTRAQFSSSYHRHGGFQESPVQNSWIFLRYKTYTYTSYQPTSNINLQASCDVYHLPLNHNQR